MPSKARRWGLWAGAAGVTLCLCLWALDRAFPLDLSRWEQRSQVVTDNRGTMIRPFPTTEGLWRLPTTPQQVDPLYLAMLTAIEDQRFGWHPGVDPLAVVRALGQAVTQGRVVSGASTLTMQAARLLQPKPRTLGAKITEALRAVQAWAHLGNQGVLEVYLTLAPFGGTLEGVRAASWGWFGKEPAHLTAAEAALLVALPQRPEGRRPDRFPADAKAARNRILDRAAQAGVLSEAAAVLAKREPLPTAQRPMPMMAEHLAEILRRRSPAQQKEISSYLDRSLQTDLQSLVERLSRQWEPGVDVAAIVVKTQGREVIAHIGSLDWLRRPLDLSMAVRSPGSALKPLIYGLAFDDLSLHPGTLVVDGPRRFGTWQPRNFDRDFRGEMTVRQALQDSLNVPAVLALEKVGAMRFAALLEQAGMALRLPKGGEAGLPLALGGVGVRLVDMAMIYADLAEDGIVRPLAWGPGAEDPLPLARRFIGQAAARAVLDILTDSPAPDGQVQRRLLSKARQVAFKTGTSFGFRDAWTVAVSPDYTVVVWVGRPDGAPRPGQLGRSVAAPLALRIVDLLPPDRHRSPFQDPDHPLYRTQPPPGLTRMESDTIIALEKRQPLQILFPPNGAEIEPLPEGISLESSGGEAPVQWVVNGLPLPPAQQGPWQARQFWRPQGEGFAHVVAIDAKGRRADVRIRVLQAAHQN